MRIGLSTLGLAALAAALWYFLDPNQGAERRERAAQSARDAYDTAERELGRLGSEIAENLNRTAGRVSDIARGESNGSAEHGARRTVYVE